MLDLNHIFLFLAVISSLLVLVRAWRMREVSHGWRVAAGIVLAITAVSWVFFRNRAGYIGGGAWFALLFLPAVGLRKMTELFAQRHYRAARTLASLLRILHPTAEMRRQVELLDNLASYRSSLGDQAAVTPSSRPRNWRVRGAPAVVIIIVLNIAVFLVEVAKHSATDPDVLHQLGALDPYSVVFEHEYWRLFTALFLHYDTVHLLFNLFALYVLGPGLERTIGTSRFSVIYLIAGLGSTAGVVLLTMTRLLRPAELVGASGCIMGVVGAWAGFLLRQRHIPQAQQRLRNILVIVAIQTAFDLSTPQVSLAAHICGLMSGFILALLIASRARPLK